MDRGLRITLQGSAWPALFCLALAGCRGCRSSEGEAYPASLSFPPRADWIVDQLPTFWPEGPDMDKDGDMDGPIRAINRHGGRAYDPAAIPEPIRGELQAEPAYVCEGGGGAGFVQVAERLLAARRG